MIKKIVPKEKNITINYDIGEEGIMCYNGKTATYIWGTLTGITYLLDDIKITTPEGYHKEYLITWDKLKKRREFLEKKMGKILNSIKIIDEFFDKKKG